MKITNFIVGIVVFIVGIIISFGWFDNPQLLIGIGISVVGLGYILFALNILKNNKFIKVSSISSILMFLTLPIAYMAKSGELLTAYIFTPIWALLIIIIITTFIIGVVRSLFVKNN